MLVEKLAQYSTFVLHFVANMHILGLNPLQKCLAADVRSTDCGRAQSRSVVNAMSPMRLLAARNFRCGRDVGAG